MAMTQDYELGSYTYPRGWFMIGDAAALGRGPLTLRYFGKDMVFYRGQSGTPHLVHAFCPHMGAHLGRNATSYIVRDGERIDGESIRCPFHGWRYGPDGRCNDVPYAPGFIPPGVRLRTYSIVERAGIIWLWHDPEEGEPDVELPAFAPWDHEAEGWVRWIIDDMGVLPIHPVEVVDNMADFAHMTPIHGSRDCAFFDNVFEGHKILQRFDAGHRTLTSKGHDLLSLDTWYEGPAILQSKMSGSYPSHMLIAHTPIEDGTVHMWHALMVKIPDIADIAERTRMGRAYQQASRDALAQDVDIWANKEPCFKPIQIPQDGPYGRVRRWYRQFYNPRAAARGIQEQVDGTVVTFGKASGAGETRTSSIEAAMRHAY